MVLRKELLSLRKTIVPQKLDIKMLEQYPAFLKAKSVFCYISAHGEVDTYGLIVDLLKDKNVLVPYCINEEGDMIACPINSLAELKDGKFNIPEPISPTEFSREEIDFVIVPGVAFDKNGYLLGSGKGYYDRFLSDFRGTCIGVTFEDCLVSRLPRGEHDIKADHIITESRVKKGIED